MKRLLRGTLLSALFFALLWGSAPAFAGQCGTCHLQGYGCPAGSPSAGTRCFNMVSRDENGDVKIDCYEEDAPECDWGAPEY